MNKRKYSIAPYAEPRETSDIAKQTGNLYHSISIVAKRSNQLALQLKDELQNKLNEFASTTDSLEEIHENKEQIEISKFYEKMPHATLLALEEFMEEKTYYRAPTEEERRRFKENKAKRNNNRRR